MLSYQHEYHAGNHADLLKHVCLCLILESLCKKEKPFTVIDSHSGSGIYDLNDEKLQKTGEARDAIEKLQKACIDSAGNIPHGVALYLEKEKKFLEERKYAGSPAIEKMFLRDKDKLHLIEKHPQAIENLKGNMFSDRDSRINIHNDDAYKMLNSLTPPLIKRGLVLCDPSFEDRSDYMQVSDTLKKVHKKWNTAIIALWYPLLTRKKNETSQMLTELEDFGKLGTNPCESIKVELIAKNADYENEEEGKSHLYGSGMFIMNPPYMLKEMLEDSKSYLEKIIRE